MQQQAFHTANTPHDQRQDKVFLHIDALCSKIHTACSLLALLSTVAKFYKSHAVPAKRDLIYTIALLWGHVNIPVEFVVLKYWDAR